MNDPIVVKGLLDPKKFDNLRTQIQLMEKNERSFANQFSRHEFSNTTFMTELHEELLPKAKEVFKSDTLVPSYNFGAWYFKNASLFKHRDINPCTYSIDLCVYQKTPWDLYVEGTPYTLMENDAIFYWGEEQQHWREEFPDPENNIVCNVLFFYVEPDHWWFTEPKEKHTEIIKGLVKERNPELYLGFDD